jgi:hypothetical protein
MSAQQKRERVGERRIDAAVRALGLFAVLAEGSEFSHEADSVIIIRRRAAPDIIGRSVLSA